MNKIISRIEALAVSETYYKQTAGLLGNVEHFISDLSFDLPFDLICGKMNIGSILKAVGIGFCDDYDSDLERFLDYMEIVREIDREKLFVFVNLRSYFGDEEIQLFIESAVGHGHLVLMVDSTAHSLLPNENRTTIDIDLCEF